MTAGRTSAGVILMSGTIMAYKAARFRERRFNSQRPSWLISLMEWIPPNVPKLSHATKTVNREKTKAQSKPALWKSRLNIARSEDGIAFRMLSWFCGFINGHADLSAKPLFSPVATAISKRVRPNQKSPRQVPDFWPP
jgi:hypothetical protein